MNIIGYAYDADLHCPECAKKRFPQGFPMSITDEHGLLYEQEDSEGNLIRPIFSTDEIDDKFCGDCNSPLDS